MVEDLKNLIALQNIDLRIFAVEKSKEELPEQVAHLKTAIEESGTVVAACQERLAGVQEEEAAFKEKKEAAATALEKSQERLNTIKTNREYDAIHAEIESNRSLIASSDTRLKAFSERIEELTAECAQAREVHETLKAEKEPEIAEQSEKIASIDSRIEAIRQEREALVQSIARKALAQYEFVHKKRKNARVISLVNEKGICTYCHKVLEPQLINDVRKGNKILACQSCGSLFIWGDEDQIQKAPEPAPAAEEEPAESDPQGSMAEPPEQAEEAEQG